MILIISEDFDSTTRDVIDWIDSFDSAVVCVNTTAPVVEFELSISNNSTGLIIKFDDHQNNRINLKDISSVWYRKGDFSFDPKISIKDIPDILKIELGKHLYEEWETFKIFTFEELSSISVLGNYFETIKSKLSYLKLAVKCGFKVPFTIVANNKSGIIHYMEGQSDWITKTISDVLSVIHDGLHYFTLTSNLTLEQLDGLPERLFPSLVQEKIHKKYELRVFFSPGSIFPAALFSQQSIKNRDDFRTDPESELRIVPVGLEECILKKIYDFIKYSGLNTGSIDLIISKDNEIYFLEVNPSGQFDFISSPCNYCIEKHLSELLIKFSYESTNRKNYETNHQLS